MAPATEFTTSEKDVQIKSIIFFNLFTADKVYELRQLSIFLFLFRKNQ